MVFAGFDAGAIEVDCQFLSASPWRSRLGYWRTPWTGGGNGICPDRHKTIMPPVGILLEAFAAGRHGASAVIILHQLAPGDGLGRAGLHGDRDQVRGDLSLERPALQPGRVGEEAAEYRQCQHDRPDADRFVFHGLCLLVDGISIVPASLGVSCSTMPACLVCSTASACWMASAVFWIVSWYSRSSRSLASWK